MPSLNRGCACDTSVSVGALWDAVWRRVTRCDAVWRGGTRWDAVGRRVTRWDAVWPLVAPAVQRPRPPAPSKKRHPGVGHVTQLNRKKPFYCSFCEIFYVLENTNHTTATVRRNSWWKASKLHGFLQLSVFSCSVRETHFGVSTMTCNFEVLLSLPHRYLLLRTCNRPDICESQHLETSTLKLWLILSWGDPLIQTSMWEVLRFTCAAIHQKHIRDSSLAFFLLSVLLFLSVCGFTS